MKVLIWFAAFFVPAALTTILRDNGIVLGGIPTFLLHFGTLALARFLCARWDVKAFAKKAKKAGLTPEDYAATIFPPSFLDLCKANKDNKSELKSVLKQSVKADVIKKSDANVLFHLFYENNWV